MHVVQENIQIQPVPSSGIHEVDMNNIPFGKVFSDHMYVARFENGAWQTPEIVPFGPLEFKPSLLALNYGQSIFEEMKAHQGPHGEALLFRPEENFRRLNDSAARLCMEPIPEHIFMDGLKALIRLDKQWIPTAEQGSLYIRPLYFGSDDSIGVHASANYILSIFTAPVGPYYAKPVSLLASKDYVRATVGGTGSAKAAGNYAGALLPDKIAKVQGYHNVLWLDAKEHQYIEECGTMNVFFVIDGTVITPNLTGTILPGITRNSVLRVLKDNGYKVETRPISIYEVQEAYREGVLEDAFGVGTAATVTHIDRIGFGGSDIHIPPVEGRSISNWLKDQVNGMRTGRVKESYGWIVEV